MGDGLETGFNDDNFPEQPFLTPVPPDSPPFLLQALQPLIYAISILRILMMVIVLAMHLVFQMTTIVLVSMGASLCENNVLIDCILVSSATLVQILLMDTHRVGLSDASHPCRLWLDPG